LPNSERERRLAGDVVKGVNLPFVLFAELGRRRQFAVPLNVRIKLIFGLAVTQPLQPRGDLATAKTADR